MSLTLDPVELHAITGYKRAFDQLRELHRQGFYRARRSAVHGGVILERAHYDAVCAGDAKPANEPRLHAPTLRA